MMLMTQIGDFDPTTGEIYEEVHECRKIYEEVHECRTAVFIAEVQVQFK